MENNLKDVKSEHGVGCIINRRTLLKLTLMKRDNCYGEKQQEENNFYVGARLPLYEKMFPPEIWTSGNKIDVETNIHASPSHRVRVCGGLLKKNSLYIIRVEAEGRKLFNVILR